MMVMQAMVPLLPAGWSYYNTPERLADNLAQYDFCSPQCQVAHLLASAS